MGNTCYQNAILQSLLGVPPFLSEMVAFLSDVLVAESSCPTLSAVAKLMELREVALSPSVNSHVESLRGVFGNIDSAFNDGQMQDASEFMIRLLDKIKEEAVIYSPVHSARREESRSPIGYAAQSDVNPVRDNFSYETLESCKCTTCHQSWLKRQVDFNLHTNVPQQPSGADGTDGRPSSLKDALQLTMRPERREQRCTVTQCTSNECNVTTKFSKLPRTLIVQLKRYIYQEGTSTKIRDPVEIPKFLSLDEYVTDDVIRPPECNWASLDGDGDRRQMHSREDEERGMQETIRLSLEERQQSEAVAVELAHRSQLHAGDASPTAFARPAVEPAAAYMYRLVSVVTHHGNAMNSGHYVSDVYSFAKDKWHHYDDHVVQPVDEKDVLGKTRQENGYIFFYQHTAHGTAPASSRRNCPAS